MKTNGERQRRQPTGQPRIIHDHFQNTLSRVGSRYALTIEKSMHSTENQPRFGAIWTSLGGERCRIPSLGAVTLRFTDTAD